MTWLQEEFRGSVRGEPGMCSFCSPRLVKSASTVSFTQWPVSLVNITCANQWASQDFRERLLPSQLAICASQWGWFAGRVVEYFSPVLFCFTPIYPHLVNLIKGTHPIEYMAYINVIG